MLMSPKQKLLAFNGWIMIQNLMLGKNNLQDRKKKMEFMSDLRLIHLFDSVVSCIDRKPMDGVPSILVHHGLELLNSNHILRWTEVFIIKVSISSTI